MDRVLNIFVVIGIVLHLFGCAMSSQIEPIRNTSSPGEEVKTTQIEFHSRVVTLYDFEPHKHKIEKIKEKSAQLDKFWSYVQANPRTTLPLLRAELNDPTNSSLFYFDGSQLLLSLSNARDDKVLALKAFPKTDLRGINNTDYLRLTHRLSCEGLDVREAAFRILDYPKFMASIPQHVMLLGQDYSLINMLYPMDESKFVVDLIQRLNVEKNLDSQKSIILALWYSVTPSADTELARVETASNFPEEVRFYVKNLRKKYDQTTNYSKTDLSSTLRQKRREIICHSISNEALNSFSYLTGQLRRAK